MRQASLIAAAALAAIILGGGAAVAADQISLSAQIQPIFDQNCVVCHSKGAENGGLNLTRRKVYKNLVGTKSTEAPLNRVEPGDPAKSYLIHKLDGTYRAVGGTGDPMPKMDIPHPLEASDMALIRGWIAEGAPNN
jgi:mono/diheme cytochrome c family protein